MNKLKKLLAVLVCAAMALTLVPGVVLAAWIDDGETADGLAYEVDSDGVRIIGYTGNATTLDIPAEIEGKPVTSIDSGAFAWCVSLASVTIPESVTDIGYSAFDGCSSLAEIRVDVNNENYKSQDGVLFDKEMTELIQYPIGNEQTSYNIPNSVTNIGDCAFQYCSSLTSVTIPDGVTSISSDAFNGCHSLTSVTIPDSVTSIGSGAFWDCRSIERVTIGNGVTYIDEDAFWGCTSLSSVTIGNGVTSIGVDAFEDCTSLTSVIIPDSVTSIGYGAFKDCTSLASVTIPDSVTSIGRSAFYGTALYNDEAKWTDSVLYIGNHLIKARDTISGGYEIRPGTVTIAYEAFAGCNNLVSITIPGSVTVIYSGWIRCGSLASVTISNGVTGIDGFAFDGCTNLTSITIPDSVTSIYSSAFHDTALYNDDTNWTDDVLYIDNHLIEARDTISGSYEIRPETVTIAGSAFADCTSLTSVTIPDSVTSIGEDAFDFCWSLASVVIPDSVTSIGDGAFHDCASLTDVTIPDSVTSIGDYAFAYAESLASVIIPNSVTKIGNGTFEYCKSLTDVYYGGSEIDWDEIFKGDYNDPLLRATIHYNSTGLDPEIKDAVISIDATTGKIEVTAQTTAIPAGVALLAVGVGADGTLIDLAPMTDGKATLNGGDVQTVKIFAWDSLESMRPLCEAKEVGVARNSTESEIDLTQNVFVVRNWSAEVNEDDENIITFNGVQGGSSRTFSLYDDVDGIADKMADDSSYIARGTVMLVGPVVDGYVDNVTILARAERTNGIDITIEGDKLTTSSGKDYFFDVAELQEMTDKSGNHLCTYVDDRNIKVNGYDNGDPGYYRVRASTNVTTVDYSASRYAASTVKAGDIGDADLAPSMGYHVYVLFRVSNVDDMDNLTVNDNLDAERSNVTDIVIFKLNDDGMAVTVAGNAPSHNNGSNNNNGSDNDGFIDL